MSLKWSSSASETGILRKNEPFERKEELLVFGYSCKIFRDNEKALHIDQGKHLIPWMGDETLKIDRYDARGALHELAALEAPPGGHDWHLELTDAEKRVEVLCDEERYRALYCDEDEEEMYKEEELKRLHAVGMGRGSYGQVGFKYDDDQGDKAAAEDENLKKSEEKAEDDEPLVLDNELNVPPGIAVPETKKLNAIIEKTALFISSHGTQMEILLKAKQAGNSQFDFLSMDCPLHAYYRYMVDAIKHHAYAPSLAKASEQTEVRQEETDNYLHPSLAAPPLQAAPSIPSIHYKPSADCDYTMLITKIRGTELQDVFDDDEKPADVPKGELAPPGTEPLTLPRETSTRTADPQLYVKSEISRGPVMYLQGETVGEVRTDEAVGSEEVHVTGVGYDSHGSNTNSPNPDMTAKKSVGLNLMHYYNSDSASESDSSDTEASVKSTPQAPPRAAAVPPAELQLIIDKMAAYVARNGDSFESTVRARNDPRFGFLESDNEFNAYYKRTMAGMRRENETPTKIEEVKKEKVAEKVRSTDGEKKSRIIAPVSFSIKKLKEPEPVLPKPALPYESSSEEEDTENPETKGQTPKPQPANNHSAVHAYVPQTLVPPSVIYKIEASNANLSDEVKKKSNEKENLSNSRRSKHESSKDTSHGPNNDSHDRKDSARNKNIENSEIHSSSNKSADNSAEKPKSKDRRQSNAADVEKRKSKQADVQNSKSKDKKHKRRHIEVKRSSGELTRSSRSAEVKVKKQDEDVKMDSKEVVDGSGKDEGGKEEGELEDGEIIMLDCDTGLESPTEFIDLTGDVSDDKTSGTQKDSSRSKRKQLERKRRAAAFLAAVHRGDSAGAPGQPALEDVAAVIQPNTLASVMVKTLCDIQAKKDAEEEQKERRKHKKRKHHRSKNHSEESSKEETEENSRKERHRRKRKLKDADRSLNEQLSHRHTSREEPEQHEKKKKKKDSSKESSRSKKCKQSRSSSKSKKERKRSPSKVAINPTAGDNDALRIEDVRQTEDIDHNEGKEKKEDKSVRKTSRRREKTAYSEGEWEQGSGVESDAKRGSASPAAKTA